MRSFFKDFTLADGTAEFIKVPKGIYTRILFMVKSTMLPADAKVCYAGLLFSKATPTTLSNSLVRVGFHMKLDAAPVTRNIMPINYSEEIYIENKVDELWVGALSTFAANMAVGVMLIYHDLNYREQLEGVFERGNK